MNMKMYNPMIQSQRVNTLIVNPGTSIFLALMLMCGLAGPVNAEARATVDAYRLAPGDQVLINVFGEDDLSMDVRLGNSGTLNYPLLGVLQIEGLTVNELEELITDGLRGPYLIDPDVTVSMKAYRSFYLNGEVEKPGGYPYEPGLTLEKAIALAGGFTEFAARKKIEVKRAAGASGESVRLRLTDPVYPGDVINVPETGLF